MKVLFINKGKTETFIDDDVYEWASKLNWRTTRNYVNRTDKNNKYVSLHRLIVGAKKGQYVDHIDGNPLNNIRQNLRLCTNAENCRNRKINSKNNSSGAKGVWKRTDGRQKCWSAEITVNYKKIKLGNFYIKEEAINAYNMAAIEFFGKYAKLNGDFK